MERLRQRDLLGVLDFLQALYASQGVDALQTRVVSGIRTVIPADMAAWNVVRPSYRLVTSPSLDSRDSSGHGQRMVDWVVSQLPRLPSVHPIIGYRQRTRDDGAVKISDFMSPRQLRNSELFTELLRPMQSEHQMSISLRPLPRTPWIHVDHYRGPTLYIGLSVRRHRVDFSERDRLILNAVHPHIAQAHRNAAAMDQMRDTVSSVADTVDRTPVAVIVLDHDDRIRFTTQRARRLLVRYFDDPHVHADRLPETLLRWLRREAERGRNGDLYAPRQPLVVESQRGALAVRLVTEIDRRVLLLEERRGPIEPAVLQSLGLTLRESQVLAAVIQAKTNPEIGAAFGMSPRTVGKHLEHIFEKFGVTSRAAAARYAVDAVTPYLR